MIQSSPADNAVKAVPHRIPGCRLWDGLTAPGEVSGAEASGGLESWGAMTEAPSEAAVV